MPDFSTDIVFPPYRMENTPASITQWRIDEAVLPVWNTAGELSTLVVPPGETLIGWLGNAAYQTGIYIGGGTQVYLPIIPEGWITTIPSPVP